MQSLLDKYNIKDPFGTAKEASLKWIYDCNEYAILAGEINQNAWIGKFNKNGELEFSYQPKSSKGIKRSEMRAPIRYNIGNNIP